MSIHEAGKAGRGGLSLTPYRDFDYPFLCGIDRAGVWASGVENFFVDEVPLYPFSGSGEHSALIVEKMGLTTRDLALSVARAMGLDNAAVGYAGMKDKDATTVQAFTVYHPREAEAVAAFEAAGAKVVSVSRHANKLRLGHLAGNRFRALIRGGDALWAGKALALLTKSGVPNFFGPQRFGAEGTNARDGLAMLTGRRKVGRFRRDLAVSALQSFVFNEVLARRMETGTLNTALLGDVLQKVASGGLFVCSEPEVDQARLAEGEVCPTGPLHGGKMKPPERGVLEAELAVLSDLGVAEELFRRETGTRRALTFPLAFTSVEEVEGGIVVSFAAPAGCFATSVIREIAASGVFRE